MRNSPIGSKTYPGATRDLICFRCSTRDSRSRMRLHVYIVDRTQMPGHRVWECTVCAYRISASHLADLPERADPDAELLHAQWREDNKDRPRWTRDHRP
jgi:hypothetical protein